MARRPGGGGDFDRMLDAFGPAARNISRRFRGLGLIMVLLVIGLILVIWLGTGIYQVDNRRFRNSQAVWPGSSPDEPGTTLALAHAD